jgi:hypothetical protein
MRVYLSGAITGKDDTAGKRFLAATMDVLERCGYNTETIDPWAVGRIARMNANLTHKEYMDLCFALMGLCDAIYFIPGWKESEGCKMERIYAQNMGMTILEGDADEKKGSDNEL